jgi:hypothetical protein
MNKVKHVNYDIAGEYLNIELNTSAYVLSC